MASRIDDVPHHIASRQPIRVHRRQSPASGVLERHRHRAVQNSFDATDGSAMGFARGRSDRDVVAELGLFGCVLDVDELLVQSRTTAADGTSSIRV